MARTASLTRNQTITQRLGGLRKTFLRPFTLSDKPPPITYPQTSFPNNSSAALSTGAAHYREGSMSARVAELANRVRTTVREPSQPTYLSEVMRSQNHVAHPDAISLPFRLSVDHLHTKTQRNIPYLRQSWSRIDFIAIVSFWITFALAMTGVERGTYHIGIFRAISVIRTARLLAITSCTTVILALLFKILIHLHLLETIMHSLKTARPLITSVAYFVLFAIVLFSYVIRRVRYFSFSCWLFRIIGVQSFKGSMRRTCAINPILGEGLHLRDGQFCGGHIDPITLKPTGYIGSNNQTTGTAKGYICPLGQSCKVSSAQYWR